MAEDIKSHAPDGRIKRVAYDLRIADEINSSCGDLFEATDSIVYALEQGGAQMLARMNDIPDDDHSPVREALALIHAAATITVREITYLARQGFWVAGAARWRALHELAVTAHLVGTGGAEIAQRYLHHGEVVSTRRLAAYYERHGVGPVGPDELASRKATADQLEMLYELANASTKFREAYGWALPLVPLNRYGQIRRPTFDVLERLAEVDVRRLLVASSHGLVHMDAAGVVTAVVMNEGYSFGPIQHFTRTILEPTLDSIIRLVVATHACFEPSLDTEFSRVLTAQAAGIGKLASTALLRSQKIKNARPAP